jgi:RHS repeat-associated protein
MNQRVVDSPDYLPFGEQTGGDTTTTHKFTDKERDSESGLDEFGARYYTSLLGRFLIPDWASKVVPVPYATFEDPQSLNLYGYVQNNPITLRDPDGHGDYIDTPEQHAEYVSRVLADQPEMERVGRRMAYTSAIIIAVFSGRAVYASALLRNLFAVGFAAAAANQPIIVDAIEGLAPGPPGTLTIKANTIKLSAQEISAGMRYAKQTGTALIESSHAGEEFVDAAGTTYDVMQAGPAANWTAKNFRNWQSRLVDHLLKVRVTIVDLHGASAQQIQDIESFLRYFNSECAEKRIQVLR